LNPAGYLALSLIRDSFLQAERTKRPERSGGARSERVGPENKITRKPEFKMELDPTDYGNE
jgi:hypothetical protein